MAIMYDVEVLFHFVDDKKKHIYEGYRPAHMIKEGYLTTGMHHYYDLNKDLDVLKGEIAFLCPEDYPECLWLGKKIEMYEGSKMVGYATVVRIINPILQKRQ